MSCSLLSPPTLQIWLASTPIGPALRLHERHKGRPEAPLIRPEKIIRIRGVVADRADAPDDAAGAGRLGREEEALRRVAKAGLGAGVAKDIVCEMMGTIVRRIRFQSLLMEIGMTG